MNEIAKEWVDKAEQAFKSATRVRENLRKKLGISNL